MREILYLTSSSTSLLGMQPENRLTTLWTEIIENQVFSTLLQRPTNLTASRSLKFANIDLVKNVSVSPTPRTSEPLCSFNPKPYFPPISIQSDERPSLVPWETRSNCCKADRRTQKSSSRRRPQLHETLPAGDRSCSAGKRRASTARKERILDCTEAGGVWILMDLKQKERRDGDQLVMVWW